MKERNVGMFKILKLSYKPIMKITIAVPGIARINMDYVQNDAAAFQKRREEKENTGKMKKTNN